MDKFLVSRVAAAILLALPLGFWLVGSEHAKAAQLASPTGLSAYLMSLQHASYASSFFAFAAFGTLYVLAVEAVSYAVRGGWRLRRASA